ncbi:DUF3618 domain-containing protein [Piscinibacter sp.]|uniref:DUF3618 domain-containing protein n=1 Tax=Piscinibacter sp. TaxID=1903157 RepID=UPI002CCF0981|nr:DUF3618 domain-containing protein [Albitalea sp.]HUG21528.1 DUF3618 domain-containing protein [Albitalea sp.]
MMKHNGHRRPEEIEAQIERTRSDLDQTLSAIESRLTPGQLMDQGLDYLRHSGARQYVSNLGESAKNDPLPLALVGVGLAWLMASNGRARSHADTGHSAGEAAASVKQRMQDTGHRISEKAHAARERASRVGESARHQVERVRGGYEYLVHEQPLALGAIGLALGAVLAASAPRTGVERRLMSGDGRQQRFDNDTDDAERTRMQGDPQTEAQRQDPLVSSGRTTSPTTPLGSPAEPVRPGISPLVPPGAN